jgi:hypothetical protein
MTPRENDKVCQVQWPDGKVELVMLNELKVLERP